MIAEHTNTVRLSSGSHCHAAAGPDHRRRRTPSAAGPMPWTSIRFDPVARTAGFSSAFMALSLVSNALDLLTDPDQGDEDAQQ